MRILLLADVHANWTALQTIEEPYDRCFFLGDLVDYGLEPAPCIEWMQRHAHIAVRGNHDHAAAQRVVTVGRNGFKYLSGETRRLTWELLDAAQLRYLGSLPLTQYVTVDNHRLLLVHATPRDPLDEYAQNDPEYWSRRLHKIDADFICVGHTHQPYVLKVGDKTVINPGSVGQPRDGNPRAAYAIWEDGEVELKRIEYEVDSIVDRIRESRLPEEAKSLSIEVFQTGRISVNGQPVGNGPVSTNMGHG